MSLPHLTIKKTVENFASKDLQFTCYCFHAFKFYLVLFKPHKMLSLFHLVIAFLESPTYLPLSLLIILAETDHFPFI